MDDHVKPTPCASRAATADNTPATMQHAPPYIIMAAMRAGREELSRFGQDIRGRR